MAGHILSFRKLNLSSPTFYWRPHPSAGLSIEAGGSWDTLLSGLFLTAENCGLWPLAPLCNHSRCWNDYHIHLITYFWLISLLGHKKRD